MQISRRTALLGAVAGTAAATTLAAPVPTHKLSSLTVDAKPITAQERNARIAKVQALLRQKQWTALLVESGSTLDYFTGIHWWQSERITAAIIPAQGPVLIVTPFFEEPSIREMLQVEGVVHPWKEDESPFELINRLLSPGTLAVDAGVRFFIIDALNRISGAQRPVVSGSELVRACRLIKSPAEIALMQLANDVTLAAMHHVHDNLRLGMAMTEIEKLMDAATHALGGQTPFSLVLLNEASAFPHGSRLPQKIRQGSVVLMDCGCFVHGYESDISRTWVFGQPTARQREIWNTVKQGQELTLATAKIGVPVGTIDKTVRAFYEQKGWARDYGLPGLSHRTGHGIGLDVHEDPYLVRNDTTPLQAGMCFSDEPGIYIPGEFGIRLEDCWHMTEAGPKLFTGLAPSIENPF